MTKQMTESLKMACAGALLLTGILVGRHVAATTFAPVTPIAKPLTNLGSFIALEEGPVKRWRLVNQQTLLQIFERRPNGSERLLGVLPWVSRTSLEAAGVIDGKLTIVEVIEGEAFQPLQVTVFDAAVTGREDVGVVMEFLPARLITD